MIIEMNKILKRLSIILMLCLTITLLGGCVGPQNPENPSESGSESGNKEAVDYAASVKLDMSSTTAKTEVTVKIANDKVYYFYQNFSIDNRQ